MSEIKIEEFFEEDLDGKILTVLLDGQEYGLPLLNTREVVVINKIDFVPRAAKFMKGVINLRGKIVPVIDLRLKFGLPEFKGEKEHRTVCLVVEIQGSYIGIIVDYLVDVITANNDQYDSSSKIGSDIDNDFICGVIKLEERVIMVLDIEKIVGTH